MSSHPHLQFAFLLSAANSQGTSVTRNLRTIDYADLIGCVFWYAVNGRKVARQMLVITLLFLLCCCAQQKCLAQAVTFTEVDIGAAQSTPGSYSYTAGTPPLYTVKGSGGGFGFFGEDLGFANAVTAGNIEIEGQLASQSSVNNGATAGLMMRESSTQLGSMASIFVTVGGGIQFIYRPGEYQSTTTVAGPPTITLPVYLRLVRSGNTISGLYSTDNKAWILVGSYTLTNVMADRFYVGFSSSSADTSTLNTAVFKFITYMTSVPQQDPNMLLWLRDDVGVTSTGTVSAWSDQSGNGHNASQTTSALQPTFVAGAINNGVLPTLTFNGTTQYLSTGSDYADLTAGASIFAVLRPTNSTSTGAPCAFGNAANSDAIFPQIVNKQASLTANNGSTSSSIVTTTNPISSSQYQLLEEILLPGTGSGTATGTIYVNGVQQAQLTTMQNLNNVTRVSDLIGAGIGPANYFNGSVAEILVFKSAVTASQRASIESYVLSKFGVGNRPTLDAPLFSISNSPLYLPGQTVTLSQDQHATVYFTVDGTSPQPSDTAQWFNVTPLQATPTKTIKAIAAAPFFINSPVASATFDSDANTLPVTRTGLVLWLRSDNVTTTGSNISQWTDISGSSNSATQSVMANQPTLMTSAVNGLPAVNFSSGKFMQIPAGMANFTGGMSLIAVLRPTAVTAGARILDFGNGATSDNLQIQEPSSTAASLYLYNGTTPSSVTSPSAITLNNFQVLECVADGTGNASIYTNGVLGGQSSTMNLLNNVVRANNYLAQGSGGGNFFQGQIAELLLYNRGISAAERAAIEGYAFSRYQTQSANTTPPPKISLASGTLSKPTQVAIGSSLAAATIYITTDGSVPGLSSPVYSKPLSINFTQTVKAIAIINGVQSSVASATFTLNATQWPAPGSTSAPLQLDLQLPAPAIPQDSNQH